MESTDTQLNDYIAALQAEDKSLTEKLAETNSKIDSAKKELEGTISTEKAAVVAELEALKEQLESELATLKAAIETLQAKDAELEKQIADLKDYVDAELKATKDWATATFATLEQYNTVASTIATIEGTIEELNTSIATVKEEITAAYTAALEEAISALETSMKEWVNEQLTGYYTIAQMDAKLEALQNSLTEGDGALQKEIDALRESLAAQKTELTEAYTAAITEAINTNNGVFEGKIAEAIGKVNEQIAGLEERITKLEGTMSEVQEQVAALVARIQSISYIPRYSDGKASIDKTKKIGVFEFQISPKDAVAELEKVWQSALTMQAVHTQTRAVSFIELPVTYFDADTENGTFLIEVDAANLGDQFFSGDIEASASLHISDGNNDRTSEYINLVVGEVESFTIPNNNEIWYTNGSTTEPTTPNKTDVFGATYVSNTYDAKRGCWVIKFDGDVTEIGNYAFRNCTALTSVTIPDSVTSIGIYAFYLCSSLTSVTIPDSVVSIGNHAFQNCYSLTSVTIPDGVTSIGVEAFNNCTSLTNITIPDSVTEIKSLAFLGCSSLTSVTIPDSVTEIGEYAFSGCSSLTSVHITDVAEWCGITFVDNPLYYAHNLYLNGELVTDLVIPDGVTEIGNYAFSNCKSLTSITIPDSVTSIGYNAFSFCASLTSVTIGNGVTEIGDSAFYGCTSLTSVTIPDSVTKIRGVAFFDCTSLTEVYCKPTTPPSVVGWDVFYGNASGRKIYVPAASVEAYKAAEYWSNYAANIVGYNF